MRKLLLISIIAFATYSCTTLKMVNLSTPKMEEIINVSGTKNELYIKANQWMVKTFTNAKSVIQFQDKEAGKIMGRYLMHSYPGSYYTQEIDVFALITISVKDNATKIDIEPEPWKYDKSGFTIYNFSVEEAQNEVKKLQNDYKTFMLSKTDTW